MLLLSPVLAAPLLALPPAAKAMAKEAGLALQATEHGATSRLTLDAPKTVQLRVEASPDSIVLRLPKGIAYDLSALGGRTPPRVAAIAALPDGLRITASPGNALRYQRLGTRIVVDIAPATREGAAIGPAAAQLEAATDTPVQIAALEPPPQATASDAPGGITGTHGGRVLTAPRVAPQTVTMPPAARSAANPAATAPQGAADTGPEILATPPEAVPLAQATPQLPPMPAAARSGFTNNGRGPYGGSDSQGRPGLTIPAQAPGAALPSLVAPPAAPVRPQQPVSIQLDAGSGRLVQLPGPAFTIMAADPRVVRVQPASPTSIFLMGVTGGRTNIIATAEDGTPVVEYDVTVTPGRAGASLPTGVPGGPALAAMNAAGIESMIRRLVRGGEGVRVANLGDRGLVLTGLVPTATEAQRAEAIAKAYAGETRPVVNNIALLSSIQVNLRVRVAEISRTVTRDLGFNWAVITNSSGIVLGMRTGSVGTSLLNAIAGATTAGATDPGRYAFRYTSGTRWDINGVIDALAGDNLISILAEPNLTAQSGEVASFLAGGEFPVPVNASPVTGAIGIEFKQFGVSLAFVPTVLSPERLNLRVRPEVSDLTDNGSISLPLANGTIRIPALQVRRAETTIELGSGQSFAIAGLLQRNVTQSSSNLIGLGDIPVIGALFRSDRFQRAETELVIIVTPYLVRPVNDRTALAAPTDGYRPATDLDRIIFRRQLARGAGAPAHRMPADTGFIVE